MEQSVEAAGSLISNLPPFLSSILEALKNEGIYLGQDALPVKATHIIEEKAVRAVNEAIRQAAMLHQVEGDWMRAARILEKIQVAAAEAERAAFIIRNDRARKCSHWAQKIARQSREYFHELKRNEKKVVKALN